MYIKKMKFLAAELDLNKSKQSLSYDNWQWHIQTFMINHSDPYLYYYQAKGTDGTENSSCYCKTQFIDCIMQT